MSAIHKLVLVFVWLAVVSSSFVFTEPAPIDVLMIALIFLLPVVGLVRFNRSLLLFLCLWLIVALGSYFAAMASPFVDLSTIHAAKSLYLYISAFIFAAFVAYNPTRHTHLILNGYLWAAMLTAIAGLIGYFELVPGAHDVFTKYGRASGTFKDPNVFGPFLIPALLYALHLVVTRRATRSIVPLMICGVLALAVFLSFSRGAWLALFISSLLWGYLSFVTTPTNMQRLKLIAIALLTLFLAGSLLTITLQSDDISDLFAQRASLDQSYDYGPDGRFGGHEKAQKQILEHPLGIGATTFTKQIHREDVHNVYLSIFLNAGWLGGFAYLFIVAITVFFGLRHCFRHARTQALFLVVYAAFIGNLLQGLVIDSDHWRHFYLLLGLLWGLMSVRQIPVLMAASRSAATRPARRLIKARKRTLLRKVRAPARAPRVLVKVKEKNILRAHAAPRRRHAVGYRAARHAVESRYRRARIHYSLP